jgi:hypothetical protein
MALSGSDGFIVSRSPSSPAALITTFTQNLAVTATLTASANISRAR